MRGYRGLPLSCIEYANILKSQYFFVFFFVFFVFQRVSQIVLLPLFPVLWAGSVGFSVPLKIDKMDAAIFRLITRRAQPAPVMIRLLLTRLANDDSHAARMQHGRLSVNYFIHFHAQKKQPKHMPRFGEAVQGLLKNRVPTTLARPNVGTRRALVI